MRATGNPLPGRSDFDGRQANGDGVAIATVKIETRLSVPGSENVAASA